MVFNGVDRGETGERQSGGIDVRQPVRLFADDRRFDRDLLAIGPFAAGVENAEHGIAELEIVDARAQARRPAGKIPARDRRELDSASDIGRRGISSRRR